ncbi:hypothetical protein MP638_005366 [Amoeboaphelidium occidentale]|nr:hypothetical protein MP638_005366 [Amoeboaphelidium occidentale]
MRKRSSTFKRITDEKLAQATFLKRLKGIYKKAWELSVMCDCDLGLIMYQSGKLYQYSSRDMDNFLLRYTSSFEPVETRTNKDFDEYFKKLEDSGKLKGGVDDDDDDDGDGSEDGGFSPEANDEPANLGRKYEPQRGVHYQQAQRTAVLPPVPTTMAQSGISPLANNFPSLKIATQPSAGNDQLFSPGPFTAMFGKPLESPTNLGAYALGSPIGVNYMFTQTPTSLERPLRTNDDFLLSQNRGSVQKFTKKRPRSIC